MQCPSPLHQKTSHRPAALYSPGSRNVYKGGFARSFRVSFARSSRFHRLEPRCQPRSAASGRACCRGTDWPCIFQLHTSPLTHRLAGACIGALGPAVEAVVRCESVDDPLVPVAGSRMIVPSLKYPSSWRSDALGAPCLLHLLATTKFGIHLRSENQSSSAFPFFFH
jgi:hypothetical protein